MFWNHSLYLPWITLHRQQRSNLLNTDLLFFLSGRWIWSWRFLRPRSLPRGFLQSRAFRVLWGPEPGSRSCPRDWLYSQSRIRATGSRHHQLQQHPHPTRGPRTGQHSSRAASPHRYDALFLYTWCFQPWDLFSNLTFREMKFFMWFPSKYS